MDACTGNSSSRLTRQRLNLFHSPWGIYMDQCKNRLRLVFNADEVKNVKIGDTFPFQIDLGGMVFEVDQRDEYDKQGKVALELVEHIPGGLE